MSITELKDKARSVRAAYKSAVKQSGVSPNEFASTPEGKAAFLELYSALDDLHLESYPWGMLEKVLKELDEED
jgi:hypothetical protein